MSMIGILLIIAIAFGSGGVMQQTAPTVCGDLSAEDCLIIETSAEVMDGVDSVAFSTASTVTMGGLAAMDESAPDSISFDLTAEGQASGDFAAFGNMQEMYTSLLSDFSPETLNAMVASYGEALNNLTMQMTMDMSLPAEMMAESPDMPASIPFEMRMADGILYLYSDLFAISGDPVVWQGLDLSGLPALYQMAIDEMFADPDMVMPSDEDLAALADLEIFTIMYDTEIWNDHVTVTRLDDTTTADGVAVAVFVTTYDYAGFYSDERVQNAMTEYLTFTYEMMGEMEGMEGMEEEMSLEDMIGMTQSMASLYSGITYSTEQWIGLEDFYVYHMTVSVDMILDMSAIYAAMPAETMEGMDDMGDLPTFTFTIVSTTDYSAFNAEFEVEVPENAEITDLFGELYGSSSNAS